MYEISSGNRTCAAAEISDPVASDYDLEEHAAGKSATFDKVGCVRVHKRSVFLSAT